MICCDVRYRMQTTRFFDVDEFTKSKWKKKRGRNWRTIRSCPRNGSKRMMNCHPRKLEGSVTAHLIVERSGKFIGALSNGVDLRLRCCSQKRILEYVILAPF